MGFFIFTIKVSKLKTVVILSSERKNGNTHKVANDLKRLLNCDIIDLLDYNIERYSYEHNYSPSDQYIELLDRITKTYDTIIFATPIYWYSMSALLKTFFDRITDLLKIEKDIGRKLRGKNMAVITSSNGGTLGDSFWLVFKESAEYLGMNYIQGVHTLEDQDNDSIITEFAQSIKSFS